MTGAEIGESIFVLAVYGLMIGFVIWVKSAPRNEADDLLEDEDKMPHTETIRKKVTTGINNPSPK